MSLAEIPQNHIRRNGHGHVQQLQATPQKSRLRSNLQSSDENYGISQEPSSIQSILRNTTETGAVGQFSFKPPVVSPHAVQISPAPSNKSRGKPSKRRHHGSYNNDYQGYDEIRGPHTPGQRTIVSYGNGQSMRGPRRMPSLEYYPSYSMTQSSYDSHSMTRRQPYANGYHHSPGNTSSVRPRSPFAYPTRLKRPGFRPSSPALSDLNRPVAGYSRGVARDPSHRTASPMSGYHVNRTPSPFHYVVNRSDPDLQQYPHYQNVIAKGARSPSTTSTRPSTPKPSPSVTSIPGSSKIDRKRSFTNSIDVRQKSPSAPPIFYDYTEEFEVQDNHPRSSILTEALSEQLTFPMESSIHSSMGDRRDSADIADIPSESAPSERKAHTATLGLDSNLPGADIGSHDFGQAGAQDLSDVPELPEKEMAATEVDFYSGRRQILRKESHLSCQSVINSTRVCEVDTQALTSSDGGSERSPQELSAEATNSRTSPTGSMFSVKTSDTPEPPFLTPEPPLVSGVALASQVKLGTPTIDTHCQERHTRTGSTHPSESLRGPSFEGHSMVSTEILSPTPERSIISPSSRDRFSKILSIDETVFDEDSLPHPPRREGRIETPTQGSRDTDFGRLNQAVSSFQRKRSIYSRNSPLQKSVTNDTLTELSDSEDEPELTAALRQTFCMDRQAHPPSSGDADIPVVVQRSSAAMASTTNSPAPSKRLDVAVNGERETFKRPPTPMKISLQEKEHPEIRHELPRVPRKQHSFRSYSPALKANASDLPFKFVSLNRRASEDDSVAEAGVTMAPNLQHHPAFREEKRTRIHNSMSEVLTDRNSMESPPGSVKSRPTSRPWNKDSSYPWSAQAPELEVTMPQPAHDSQERTEKAPRFKFKIHRASSPTGGTGKLRTDLLPSDTIASPFALSQDLDSGPAFRRKRDPNLSVVPGQNNSSHDVIHSSRQRAHFVDTFEAQSPTYSLLPPSPNFEARSFFSDDSSQIRKKNKLRKRFSDFKARTTAARATSVDGTRGYDRGLLSSALGRSRASGRSSKQSQNTAGVSTRASLARRVRWRMIDKIRLWVHRGEDKVRGWGRKRRHKDGTGRADSAPLYNGV